MHFFIEHTQLPVQTADDMRFGPDPANPANWFNFLTQFQLSASAKAFACERGMMIVQKNNEDPVNLVNIVIKPLNKNRINGITVKYYYYRGITRTSFLDSNQIVPSGEGRTEFIQRYWERRERVNQNTSNFWGAHRLSIGYGDISLEGLGENRSLEDVFSKRTMARAVEVSEGMWIGNFTNSRKIGFEIELESEPGFNSTLLSARQAGIRVNTVGANTDLALRYRKELVFSFIDPAAFFGMHTTIGVNTTTYSGNVRNESVLETGSSLYENIITKFYNKNRIYLDIRSERGLSYNFYRTYQISSSNPANIRLNGGAESEAIEYGSEGWPLLFWEIRNPQGAQGFNKLTFRLRTNDNTQPVIFLANDIFSSPTAQNRFFLKYIGEFRQNTILPWTQEVPLYYANAGLSNNWSNISNYIKIHYFLENETSDAHRLRNEKYFDSAFCSIDLNNLVNQIGSIETGHIKNPNPLYIKEKLHPDGTGNFAYTSENGAYWTSQKVLFYSKKLYKEAEKGSGKKFLNTYKRGLLLNNRDFNDSFKDDFDIVVKRYQIPGALKIMGINYYKDSEGVCEKEDLLLLGLSNLEVRNLNMITGFSQNHPRYLFLERTADYQYHLVDTNRERYYRYNLFIQGLDEQGNPIRQLTGIDIFSRDNIFFHTIQFAADEVYSPGYLTDGDNEITFTIYKDGAEDASGTQFSNSGGIFINDNIDWSLIRKSEIVDVLFQNGDPVYTLIDDNSIEGDTSRVKLVHYIYDRSLSIPSVPALELCRLRVVMADGRLIVPNLNLTANESSASTEAQFNNLGYTRIFDYTPFNGNGVWAKHSYLHTGRQNPEIRRTDAIMTRGKTKQGDANRKYIKTGKKAYMVYMDKQQIVDNELLRDKFTWSQTVRCFGRPDVAAVFLGALSDIVEEITNLVSQGFAYPDASSFPSELHVNGNAFDTNYFSQGSTSEVDFQRDVTFCRAIHRYGTGLFRIGPAFRRLRLTLNPRMRDTNGGIVWTEGWSTHDDHLHTEDIVIHR